MKEKAGPDNTCRPARLDKGHEQTWQSTGHDKGMAGHGVGRSQVKGGAGPDNNSTDCLGSKAGQRADQSRGQGGIQGRAKPSKVQATLLAQQGRAED